MKKSKETLAKELALAEQNAREWKEIDDRRRKDLSAVLNAPFESGYGARDQKVYSWAQIYAEIGKLIAARTFLDLEGNVSAIEVKVEGIERLLNERK